MLAFAKRWLHRLAASFKTRLQALLRRKRPPAGKWVSGAHTELKGWLYCAPFVPPRRHYRLYLPPTYVSETAAPLLVMIHGCKQDAETFAAGTRMNRLADLHGFLVLYPEQRRLANPQHCWNWFDPSARKGGGEAAIIAGMIEEITSIYPVDRSRIYVAGMSSGGGLTSILASCYAPLFAAAAVHSGLMFIAATSPQAALSAMEHGSPNDPMVAGKLAFERSGKKFNAMPMMVVHGSADTRVNPVNADQIIVQFAKMNDYADDGTANDSIDGVEDCITSVSPPNQMAYKIYDYRCRGRLLMRKVIVEGMGHAWSGGDATFPFNDPNGPDASQLIWEFFCQHQRTPAAKS